MGRVLHGAGSEDFYLCNADLEATWRLSDKGGFMEGRERGLEAKFMVL